jgi:hypothetical protein
MTLFRGESQEETQLLPVIARIAIAADQLRVARAEGDPSREWAWESMCNRLLDIHIGLMQECGTFRPLEELDPDLAERLAPPASTIRFVAAESRR